MLEQPSSKQAYALRPSFSGVLRKLGGLKEVFLMARNDGCVLGSLANPLHYMEAGCRSVAWSEELTLTISQRRVPEVMAYSQNGDAGVEFFGDGGRGFLKIFPTAEISLSAWNEAVASLSQGRVRAEILRGRRKTNHLGVGFAPDRGMAAVCPDVRGRVEGFFQAALEARHPVDVLVPCGMVRGDLRFIPQSMEWKGQWLFAMSGLSGCHLRVAEDFSAVENRRAAGVRTLDIFDGGEGFVARLTSRPKQTKHS